MCGERCNLRLLAIGFIALILLLAGCGDQRPPITPAATATAPAGCVPVAGHATSAASIQISPTSGGPGTVICITGYLPGGPDAGHANEGRRHGTACWDGCRGSLTESVDVAWAAGHAGFFATRLTVPTTAWLTSDGPKALASGTYRVGVQCIAPTAGGCATQPAQATASFRLTGPAPSLCAAGQPCATLRFTPDAGVPGTRVRVSGWAPLTEIIGQPMGYTLVAEQGGNPPLLGQVSQKTDGSLSGTLQLPASWPGGGQIEPGTYTVALEAFFSGEVGAGQPVQKGTAVVGGRLLLAPTALTISAALTWASLGPLHPLAEQASASLFGGSVAAAGNTVAYCVPGGVRVSRDGGQTWSTLSAAGIAAAAAKIGYVIPGYQQKAGATCQAVTVDPSHPESLYLTYGLVTAACDCLPPAYMVGFVTRDGGRTWSSVPQPAGFTSEQGDLGFGGFQAQGDAVAAVFGRWGAGAPTVEVTTDGGRTWKAGQLGCPATGPCVRWGAAPSSVSACMTEFPQPVEASADGGASWVSPTAADLCTGVSQLVAISPREVALVSGQAAYPLQISRDGGRSWTYVAAPPLDPTQGVYQGLMMLPDGALLAMSSHGTWEMLKPAGKAWCAVPTVSAPANTTPKLAAAGRLWWLAGGSGNRAPVLHSVPLAALTCG